MSSHEDLADRAHKLAETKRQKAKEAVTENAKLYREIVPAEPFRRTDEMVSEFYDEQEGLCALCGDSLDPYKNHVDHKIPSSKGGGSEPENLQLAHPSCNQSKGNKVDTPDLHYYLKDEVEKRNW